MRSRIQEIAKAVTELEEKRRLLAKKVRERNEEILPDAIERELVHSITPAILNCSVGAVDGGLLAQEFQGFDLILARALGVVFTYKDSKLCSHKYVPNALPEPDIDALSCLDMHEFMWHKSLFRLAKEIRAAQETIERYSPDYLLLDGSIVPQISDKPSEDSVPRALYDQLIQDYDKLYSTAEEKNCTLIGVIKDSRGKRFIELLEKTLQEEDKGVLLRSNDTSFLHFMLNEGERTFAFTYSSSAKEHQILRDLGKWGSRVNTCYLKPAPEDRPLRIEFLDGAKTIDEIAPLIHSLSRINKKYAYPAVLIEADLRAALNPIELERAYKELFLRAGMKSIMKLRRDSRPFR